MMFSSRNFQLWISCQFFHVFYVRSQVTGQPVTGSYLVRHSPLVKLLKLMFAVVQWPSHVWLFVTPWTAACQASLSLTISWSLPKFMSIASAMSSHRFILWHLLLLPSIFSSIREFFNELVVRIRWTKCWNFSINISPSNGYSELISLKTDWFDLLAV